MAMAIATGAAAQVRAAEAKLRAGVTSLILEEPFYGALVLSLPFKADFTCKTAWTDGRNIGYNPAYILSLTHDVIVGVLEHEVSHVALGHPWRRDARDPKGWNISCDKVINHNLREAGKRLPANVYYATGDEIGKSAEWVFTRMGDNDGDTPSNEPQKEEEEEQASDAPGDEESEDSEGEGEGEGESDEEGEGESDEDGEGEGDGDGQPGDSDGDGQGDGMGDYEDPLGEVRDAPTTESEDGEPPPTEQEWKQKVQEAARVATAMGNMPAGMARDVAEALRPQLDVRSLLLRFFTERSAGDFTWTRPNPRYVSMDIYLPALESSSLGRVGILTDTSGSMDDVTLQYARGIVESVIEECSPEEVINVYADAAVCRVDRFHKNEPLTWEPDGGGGTDFRPALKFFEEDEDGEVTCIVAITDLDGTFPETPTNIPVLWLAIPRRWGGETRNESIAPFGETVPVEY